MEHNILPVQDWAPYFTRNKTCECGVTVRCINYPRHIITQRHFDRLRELKGTIQSIGNNKKQHPST